MPPPHEQGRQVRSHSGGTTPRADETGAYAVRPTAEQEGGGILLGKPVCVCAAPCGDLRLMDLPYSTFDLPRERNGAGRPKKKKCNYETVLRHVYDADICKRTITKDGGGK